MEKQPVNSFEFVRLLTIVSVAEALATRIEAVKQSMARSPVVEGDAGFGDRRVINLTNYLNIAGCLATVVRDYRPGIFDNFPIRLGEESVAGQLLRQALEEVRLDHPVADNEDILRDAFWQHTLMTFDLRKGNERTMTRNFISERSKDLAELTDNTIDQDLVELGNAEWANLQEGETDGTYTRVHGKLIRNGSVQTYLSSIHLDAGMMPVDDVDMVEICPHTDKSKAMFTEHCLPVYDALRLIEEKVLVPANLDTGEVGSKRFIVRISNSYPLNDVVTQHKAEFDKEREGLELNEFGMSEEQTKFVTDKFVGFVQGGIGQVVDFVHNLFNDFEERSKCKAIFYRPAVLDGMLERVVNYEQYQAMLTDGLVSPKSVKLHEAGKIYLHVFKADAVRIDAFLEGAKR